MRTEQKPHISSIPLHRNVLFMRPVYQIIHLYPSAYVSVCIMCSKREVTEILVFAGNDLLTWPKNKLSAGTFSNIAKYRSLYLIHIMVCRSTTLQEHVSPSFMPKAWFVYKVTLII